MSLALQRKLTFNGPSRSSYAIDARTLAGAARAMEAHDPEEAGKTTWPAPLKTVLNADGDVSTANIVVNFNVLLPNWPGASLLKGKSKAEWGRFFAALTAHENSHVTRAKAAFGGADKRLVGHSPSNANDEYAIILGEVQASSDVFDAANDHGRNAGTVLNENP